MGRVEHVLHLRCGEGEDVGIGIGRSARHIAGMAEEVGGAPEQLDARSLHLGGEIVGHLRKIAAELGEVLPFGNDVTIMKGEERRAEQREHFESDVGFELGRLHRLAEPWTVESRRAEHVDAGPGEIVPIANGGPQMLGDGLAGDFLAGFVMAEGQRIVALYALVANRRNVAEETGRHRLPPMIVSCRSRTTVLAALACLPIRLAG